MSDNFYQLYFDPKSAPVVFRQPQNLHNRYKIALIGAPGVGKSCLLSRLTENVFPQAGSRIEPVSVTESVAGHASVHTSPTENLMFQSGSSSNSDASTATTSTSRMSTSATSVDTENHRHESNDLDFDDQFESRLVDWVMPRDKQKFKVEFVDVRGCATLSDNTFIRDACAVMLVYAITDRASFTYIDVVLRQLRRLVPPDCDVIIVGNQQDRSTDRVVQLTDADDYAGRHGCSLFEVSAKTGSCCRDVVDELLYKWIERRQTSQYDSHVSRGDRQSLHEDAVEAESDNGLAQTLSRSFCIYRCL